MWGRWDPHPHGTHISPHGADGTPTQLWDPQTRQTGPPPPMAPTAPSPWGRGDPHPPMAPTPPPMDQTGPPPPMGPTDGAHRTPAPYGTRSPLPMGQRGPSPTHGTYSPLPMGQRGPSPTHGTYSPLPMGQRGPPPTYGTHTPPHGSDGTPTHLWHPQTGQTGPLPPMAPTAPPMGQRGPPPTYGTHRWDRQDPHPPRAPTPPPPHGAEGTHTPRPPLTRRSDMGVLSSSGRCCSKARTMQLAMMVARIMYSKGVRESEGKAQGGQSSLMKGLLR